MVNPVTTTYPPSEASSASSEELKTFQSSELEWPEPDS